LPLKERQHWGQTSPIGRKAFCLYSLLYLSTPQFPYGVITGSCRQRHICQTGIKTGAGSHTAAIRDKDVRHIMHLVKAIQHAGTRIPAHTGNPHFMIGIPGKAHAPADLYIRIPRGNQHTRTAGDHILMHGFFIVTEAAIYHQLGSAKCILFRGVQRYTVVAVRQAFTKGVEADAPWSGFDGGIFQPSADACVCTGMLAISITAKMIPPQEPVGLLCYVLKTGNVNIGGPAAIVIAVCKARYFSSDGQTLVMIHQVTPHLAAAIAQTIGKTPAGAVVRYAPFTGTAPPLPGYGTWISDR